MEDYENGGVIINSSFSISSCIWGKRGDKGRRVTQPLNWPGTWDGEWPPDTNPGS